MASQALALISYEYYHYFIDDHTNVKSDRLYFRCPVTENLFYLFRVFIKYI